MSQFTNPVVDPGWYDLADLLRECFETKLGRPVCLRPGQTIDLFMSRTRDECCEGAAWVRLGDPYPSTDFPLQDVTAVNCPVDQWALPLELGAALCVPTPDEDTIPSCTQHTDVVRQLLDDMAAMRCALLCFTALEPERQYLAGQYTQLQVEGGCGGGVLPVTLAVEACDTCGSDES